MLFGFTTQNGKYIDASNLANIYAYSTTKSKYVKIEEYDDYDTDTKLSASLLEAPVVLAQDKDYIYAKVKVVIFDGNTSAVTVGTTTSGAVSVIVIL
jgi:preprotein translocase subunit SecA